MAQVLVHFVHTQWVQFHQITVLYSEGGRGFACQCFFHSIWTL